MKLALLIACLSVSAAAGAPDMMPEQQPTPDSPPGPEMVGDSSATPEVPFDRVRAPKQELQSEDGADPQDLAAPRFRVETALTETDPRVFARKLSQLLGIEVRIGFDGKRKLTLEAKEWTAAEALNRVARQIQGEWGVEFSLTPASPAKISTASPKRLLPLGTVSVEAPSLSLSKALKTVAERAGCRLVLPRELPAVKVRLALREMPVDRALSDLAAKANRAATAAVVIDLPETAERRTAARVSERLQEELAATAEVNAYLIEAYGGDPADEGFPWENIDVQDLSITLAARLDITPDTAGDLLTKIRGEAISLRSTLAHEREGGESSPASPE